MNETDLGFGPPNSGAMNDHESPMTVHTIRFAVAGADIREVRARVAAASLAHGPGLAAISRTGESGRDVIIGYEVPLASVAIADPVVSGDPVALARDVFTALEALHARELAGGALTLAHVLISPDARIWLVGWGIDRHDPARDVAAAAALITAWAERTELDPALAAVLTMAGSADANERPSAAEVAHLLKGVPRGSLQVDHVVPRPAAAATEPAGGQRASHRHPAPEPAPASPPFDEPSAHTTVRQWRSGPTRSDVAGGGSAARRGSGLTDRTHRGNSSQRPSRLLAGAALAVIAAVGLVSWARATAEESPGNSVMPTRSTIGVSAPPDPDASVASPSPRASSDPVTTTGPSSAVVGVIATTPALGTSSAGRGRVAEPDSAAASAGPAVQGTDWAVVIGELDRLRGRAFASPDGSTALDYAVPGQSAWIADRAALATLAAAGQRIRGLTSKVLSIAPIVERDTSLTTLRVTDIRSSYEVLARDGAVIARIPLSTKTIWRVSLALRQGRWLIDSVEREEPRSS